MLALLASLMLPACAAPLGTDVLLARPEQVIVVGELHGTNEAPDAFAEIVCQAALAGPVTVALEYPPETQATLEGFIEAPEAVDAMDVLGRSDFFRNVADGRTSEAMVQLLFTLQSLRWERRDVIVRAIQPGPRPASHLDQSWYELDMGHAIADALLAAPERRVFVLVGNLHARKTPHPLFGDQGVPAAGHLPARDVITLDVAPQGGEAWNCQPDCGVHGGPGRADNTLRGVILGPAPDGAYDGVIAVGPTTASPPIGRVLPN